MRRSSRKSPTWLVPVVVAHCVLVPLARAFAAPPADSPAPADSAGAPVVRNLTPAEWDALNLARAVDLWLAGDLRGAASLLEDVDISPASTFDRADRAAFLLAAVYLRLGDAEAFDKVAARAADSGGSPYRRWIRYCQLFRDGSPAAASADSTGALPEGFPGVDIMGAALLMETGQPGAALRLLDATAPASSLLLVHLYMEAVTRTAAGDDPDPAWERLASQHPQTPLESDLVATARMRQAVGRIGKSEDAMDLLRNVPRESRLAPRADHLLGIATIAAGDTTAGYRILEQILKEHPAYEARRDVKLALGDVAMDRAYWSAALRYFESAEDNWEDEYRTFSRLEDDAELDRVWSVWSQPLPWRDEIRLASDAVLADVLRLAGASLDLRRDPVLAPPENLADGFWPETRGGHARAPWDSTDALSRHAPLPEEWDALRTLHDQRLGAASRLARQERRITDRQAEIGRRLEYLERGGDHASTSAQALADGATRLQGILSRLEAALARLRGARDIALEQVAVRTRDMIEDLRRETIFMQALQHFYVDGPQKGRPETFPEGIPSPGEVLAREEALAGEAERCLSLFAERNTQVINRSFTEVWTPRFARDSMDLHHGFLAELARAGRIGTSIDSTTAWYRNDPELAALTARLGSLSARSDSLERAETAMKRDIAHAVARRGRAELETEHEAIDYHLADATYELAIDADTNPKTAVDSTEAAPMRDRAIALLDAFLARYPDSAARGEGRYRLADLRLLKARDDFQARMTGFLGEKPSANDLGNRALAPFVDYAPAVALYRKIIAEDTSYPHMDAVLFNLGMILSDDGQPDATGYLERLVAEYPKSPDVQEAWLRMGSERFDRKDFAGCAPLFEHAADGNNPSFTAIALYKLGWARFEGDHFGEAADAFRRLMDHYAAHADVARKMNLREEAEEYLVHSLARSGGADAFRDYFDSVGHRDYESRVLTSMGHLMRSNSLYPEAVACDQLWLSRYATDPEAIEVADRMVATYRRWNKPDAARDAKLAQAERFLPGSPWYQANTGAKERAAAQEFARSAYRETGAYYHKKARETNDAASWRSALANYEQYLAQWPRVEDSDRVHFAAGEAAGRLGAYLQSLAHFAAAARSDSAALAADAAWQQVAVTDAWYRSSRPAETKNGSDSLAVKLLATSSDFVERHPDDVRSADIVWRQGNVAYAHGWFTEAATSLASFGDRYPTDPRATRAVRLSGDARYRRGEYDLAGATYEKALGLARTAHEDSVVARLQAAIPHCYFKYAEGVAAADSAHGDEKAAPLFARVAHEWPAFKHTDLALYRAGLGFAAHKSYEDATAAWEQLLADHPKSEYARDSAAQIALAHEKSGNARSAASAYERFSRLYPQDPDAPEALLKAVDLLAGAKDEAGAEDMRTQFLSHFPGETQAVMEIRASRAKRELADVAAGRSQLSTLLAAPKASKGAAPASDIAAYLALAAKNPDLASAPILAEVDYLKAEAMHPEYTALRLTQPLPPSIEKKKAKMEALVAAYEACTKHAVTEYARASAYRIGQVLIEFGDALAASERPKDLSEEDAIAYDDVLREQSFQFYDRGEDVWSELLRQVDGSTDDPGEWIAQTRAALWPRLGQRFLFQPAVDYPLVAAKPPAPVKAE